MIDQALGEILLGEDEPGADTGEDEIRILATMHGADGELKFGARRELVVRFALSPGLHVYDEPVPQGMLATHIEIDAPEGLHSLEWIKPRPSRCLCPA